MGHAVARKLDRAPVQPARRALTGHDQIDRLGTFSLFVGFDIEADALALYQRFQPRAFNGGDVYEHVAACTLNRPPKGGGTPKPAFTK